VLFAAAMAGRAEPQWLDAALEVMQQSQAPLVELLAAHGCQACTDITGFGLLGHLGEMLACSQPPHPGAKGQLVVDLDSAAIPVYAGVLELLAGGWASSLAPANAEALALLNASVRLLAPEPIPPSLTGLLIDPQTCGPLLAAVPGELAPAALRALHLAGFGQARVIAQVRDCS
jgi:selenide,water dikinase